MNDKAQADFIARVDEARELTSRIMAHLGDHLGYDPEAINWAHVGTARAAIGALREAAQMIGLEEPK